MTISQARDILGKKFKEVTDEQLEELLHFIQAVCQFVISNETSKDGEPKIE